MVETFDIHRAPMSLLVPGALNMYGVTQVQCSAIPDSHNKHLGLEASQCSGLHHVESERGEMENWSKL